MAENLSAVIDSIEKCLREANNSFLAGAYNSPDTDEYDNADAITEYYVERSFVELLILLEHLNLVETYRTVASMFELAKKSSLTSSKMGVEDPYLCWVEKIRLFVDGISNVYGMGDTAPTEVRDLKAMIKRSLYAICDTNLFPASPSSEADVHDRIEGILKCQFSDLKRKPSLSKPIKNFVPDTGIPSIKTLIEYKFVTTKDEAKRVVDEILADASGYRTPKWKNLLFVIYETNRVMPEEDWTALLRECELGISYDAIVLSGHSKPESAAPKK